MSKKILIYDHFSLDKPILLGYLFADEIRGNEHYSFEYNKDYLSNADVKKRVIDPDISPIVGRQYPNSKQLFGVFSDSCPDRWGRTLIDRKERITANNAKTKPKKLFESDYLLGVYDETRMGGLRYTTDYESGFMSSDKERACPPWISLRSLEEASRNFENEENILNDKWLNQLIRPGSSLGGARPKATVRDANNQLWLAKFPSKKDEYNVGVWEYIAYELAKMCKLNTSETKLENFSSNGSTFLVKRFDRKGEKRVHFASAMTMLGKNDGDLDASYLDIASFIKSNSISPEEDLLELWKRIIFNMLITNSDDHLRNHGFLLTKSGWKLSPVYDINPTPYGNLLSLLVDKESREISIDLAIDVAPFFNIKKDAARKIYEEMSAIISSNWKSLAANNGLSRKDLQYMEPAFYCTK